MPTLTDTKLTPLIKLILMGFSGKGKSTSIVPLAIPELVPNFPGYKINVFDYDGKFAEVAINQLKLRRDSRKANRLRLIAITEEQYKAACANINVEVLREKTKLENGKRTIIGPPRMWEKTDRLQKQWEKEASPNTIFVVDSWTHMCGAPLLSWAMAMQGKTLDQFGDAPHGRDYMLPQKVSKDFMAILADSKAHVIINSHQSPTDIRMKTGEFDEKGNAVEEVVHSEMSMISVGSAGRIQLPSEFNHTLVVTSNTEGVRKISTQIEDGVTTKTPFYGLAEKNYNLDTGLVEYWMLGNEPNM